MTFHLDRIGCGDVFEIVEEKTSGAYNKVYNI